MKNKNNLPKPILNALTRDREYTPSTDRIAYNTELPTPPRVRWLKERHREEIKENQDASDFLLMLLGTALHKIVEQGAEGEPDLLAEERLILTVPADEEGKDWRISSTVDLYDKGSKILYDYKVTTVWKMKDEVSPEWAAELNVSAEALRQAGESVAALRLVYFLRDHTPKWARENKEIDQGRVAIVDVPMWTPEEVTEWVRERVRLKLLAEQAKDQTDLPECTPEETWARPSKWAVMKKGRKSAVRLFDEADKENAKLFAVGEKERSPGTYYLEFRPGERPKCKDYCDGAPWCVQYAEWKKAAGTQEVV